ncbi:MAG: hypothetical protein HQL72_15575 [Magnetococcales bacterium]|nr:hypothetical protein [Magnetococcales bacterium]
MGQSSDDFIPKLFTLVREQRLYEARCALDDFIKEAPEMAAQWLVLARLMTKGESKWLTKIQQGLEQGDSAPQKAFQKALETLEHSSEAALEAQENKVERLTAYLTTLQGLSPSAAVVGSDDLVREQGARLEHYLLAIRGHQARKQLDVRGRKLNRLAGLASNLSRALPSQPVANPLVNRLQSLLGEGERSLGSGLTAERKKG